METQLLIEELTPSQAGLIQESSNDGKNTWINGIFMQGSIKNRNGRIYPLSEIETAVRVANEKIAESNGIFGELDHPSTLTINLDRISHAITEIKLVGNNAIGRAKLLGTPMGNIAKELVESGVYIGVSSRGYGQVNEDGSVLGFNFVTVDLVATPSAPEAYPQSVVESLDHMRNGNVIIDLAEAVRYDDAAQKYFKQEIMKWLNTGIFMKK